MILSRHVVHDESAFPAKIHAAPSQCGPIARDNRLVTPLVVTLLMVNTQNGLGGMHGSSSSTSISTSERSLSRLVVAP